MLPEFKKKSLSRLQKIKGQTDGIIKMIEDEKYCGDVLTQILALHGAVKGVGMIVLESHLNTCGAKSLNSKNKVVKQKFINEIMKICDLSSR
jgi:DNA-binding FrmR family transcriptional regulator